MPRYGNTFAATLDEYTTSMATENWRTTVYEEGACFKLMTHKEYIEFAVNRNLKLVPELLDGDWSQIASANTAEKAANLFARDYTVADGKAIPSDLQFVFPQSSLKKHVETWLARPDGALRNAVFKYCEGCKGGDDTWDSTYHQDFTELLALENPIRYASTGMQELLMTKDWGMGGELVGTTQSDFFKANCIAVFAGTFESGSFYSRVSEKNENVTRDFSDTLPENRVWASLHLNASKRIPAKHDLQRVMQKDADMLLLIDALFTNVSVEGVFSEWPSTVSHYINCVHMTDRYTDGSNVVDFGVRPWYLAVLNICMHMYTF